MKRTEDVGDLDRLRSDWYTPQRFSPLVEIREREV